MSEQPNLLLIICDQMRRQAMGCAEDPNVATPALDRLAAEGTRFTNASSTCPICVPARFSMMTGEYAHTRHAHHGWRMSPTESTVAHDLRGAGYETGYVGKWHLADVATPERPIPESLRGGFEHWRGFDYSNRPFETVYFADDDPKPRQLAGYQTDGLVDLGMDFIDKDRDRPFFLVLSVEPPHPPFNAPEPYLDDVSERSLELRPNVPNGDPDQLPQKHVPPAGLARYDRWGDPETASDDLYERHEYHGVSVLDEMRGYYAMIEHLDDAVGRLLDRLESLGIRNETAVAFTADHGEMLGSHGLMMKQHPYEESIGIPFIVSQPDVISEGQTIDTPVALEDWRPTLCGLAGTDTPDGPGRDLAPLLRGATASLDRPGVLLEFVREIRDGMPYHDDTWRGFRTERYKYTVKGPAASGGEPWQLFDLKTDPYEQTNLLDDSDSEPIAAELHGHLRAALDRSDDDYALVPAFGHPRRH